MTVDILNQNGQTSGSIDLPEEIFGIEPNVAVMHQAVKAHLANRRQGTSKAKPRNEVRGGGRKPWRQKGRGTARAGTIRSPLWVGGGNIHGPSPRNYRQKFPRKMHQLARRSALALKFKANEIVVVEDLNFSEIRTKPFADMLKAIEAHGRKSLVLLAQANDTIFRSARNIADCEVIEARNASTYQLLDNQMLVLERSSLDVLIAQLRNQNNGRRTANAGTADAGAESTTPQGADTDNQTGNSEEEN